MRVPIVEMLLREIDPEGMSERRHRLRRWIDFFNDLIAAGILRLTDQLEKKLIITR